MTDNTLKSGSSLQGGKYIIHIVLGQGGFGITYEAEQVSLRRKVAVKEFFMKDSCERDGNTSHVTVPTASNRELVSKFKDKFIREARMIAALDHEHIVRIHDVFEENGTAYYVMEYLGGGCLGDGVKAGKALAEREAVESIRQIASALSYLHNKGIIHFDVKPSNVLKTEDGKLKLIDFGISKHYDEAGVQTSSTPVGISKGYAPLEQYQQGSDIKSFTPATDVYSLGATLYALLSGSNPPEASLIYEDGLPIIDGISPAVMRAVEKAMQPRRKERPQSVEEFLQLLDSSVTDDEETIVPGPKPTPVLKPEPVQKPSSVSNPTPKPVRKGFPKWLYGVFAGIAVAVLAVVLLNRPAKQDVPDLQQIDSTAVVADAVPETPAKSQLSETASKPESPANTEAPAVIELKSISLDKTTLELEEGSSATLTVKYTPNNATDKTTTWKSSDASIAKVSSSGKVTAVKAGSAAIIATCGGRDVRCNVSVTTKKEEDYIKLNNERVLEISVGKESGRKEFEISKNFKDAVDISKSSTYDKDNWFDFEIDATSRKAILTYSENTAEIGRAAEIILKKKGSSAKLAVILLEQERGDIKARALRLSKTHYTVNTGDVVKLEYGVEPEEATGYTVSFKSDNTNVATVDNKGIVTAKSAGTANVSVSLNGSTTLNCSIEVRAPSTQSNNNGLMTVSGRVTDKKTGEPVMGASVIAVGTISATITDMNGDFRINVSPNASLSFSYLGYKTVKQKVDGRKVINIKL